MIIMASNNKDVGIDWLGKIPDNWIYCRFKDAVNIYVGNSIKDEDKDNYCDDNNARSYISSKDIDVTFNTINYDTGLYIKNDDLNFRIAPKFSTLMCIEGGSAGRKKAITLTDVSFVNKLCCFIPKNNDLYYEYLYYFLCSPNYEDYFFSQMTGLIGGVSVSKLKDFNLLLPPIEEQKNICNFLNRRVKIIDEILNETLNSIKKYEEYKQSLITEAVTKSLNNNVEMKNIDIDWIGEIPKHWDIIKLKRCCDKITDGSHYSPDTSDEGKYYITVRNIIGDTIDFTNAPKISFEDYVILKNNGCKPEKNDVLLSKDGTIGKCVVVNENIDFVILSSLGLLKPNNLINPEYLRYFLISDINIGQMYSYIRGSALKRLTVNIIKELLIILPPIEEQEEIIKYLDKKCNPINQLISEKENIINKLEEYKKSLIFEYVTGKKEVPK